MGQSEFELLPIWDARTTSTGSTDCAMVLAPAHMLCKDECLLVFISKDERLPFCCFYLVERVDGVRNPPCTILPPHTCSKQLELYQAKARNSIHLGLLHEWQGLKYMHYHFLPPTVLVNGRLNPGILIPQSLASFTTTPALPQCLQHT